MAKIKRWIDKCHPGKGEPVVRGPREQVAWPQAQVVSPHGQGIHATSHPGAWLHILHFGLQQQEKASYGRTKGIWEICLPRPPYPRE